MDKRDAEIERLIERIGQGEPSCMEELYSHMAAPVFGYSLSMLGDRQDAEDVLHDCVVRIYLSAGKYVPKGKPLAWIIRIARNLCIDRIRERKRAEPSETVSERILQEYPLADAEDGLMLQSFLSLLAPEDRRIIALHASAGFTFREIAKEMGMKAPTVMSRYRRAMIKLRKEIGEGGEET